MRRTAQLLRSLLSILLITAGEGIQFLWLAVWSRAELSAEVLFLRKQLAFYQEHQVRPRRLSDAARFSLVLWSQLFNWRAALMIVKPETLIGWHRKGFKLFWRWKSRLGRPRIPENFRQLVVGMGQENPARGEGAHGAGEPDRGRGAHRSRTFGEARNPGFAPNGAGVLAAREGSARR